MRSSYIKVVLTPGMSTLVRDIREDMGSDRRRLLHEDQVRDDANTTSVVSRSPKRRRQDPLALILDF